MNELHHHGIKGMRWGVRRYQNADGSLTADGRRRYGYGSSRFSNKTISRGNGREHSGHVNNGVGAQVGYGLGQIAGSVAGARMARDATANVINLVASARNVSTTQAMSSPLTTLGIMAAGYLTVMAGTIVGRAVGQAVGSAVDASKESKRDSSNNSERSENKKSVVRRIAAGTVAVAAVAGIAYAAYKSQNSRIQVGEDAAHMLEDNMIWITDFDVIDG